MAKQNFLDKCIAAVSPVRAVRRAAARTALEFVNSGYGNYGANTTKKSMRGWMYYGGSTKEDIEDNIDVLRQRSRDAYMGIPIAAAALKTLRTNVVAGGLMPSPQIDADFLGLTNEQAEALQAQVLREFSLWADTPVCDADRMDNFYKLQQLAFLSYLMNGDAIALLPVKEQPGSPYSLRVRIIEADRVCSPNGYDRLTPCVVAGRDVYSIVQGVETDESGTVVAYWISNRHPLASLSTQAGALEWTRVEAYGATGRPNVLHVMNRERAGQLRGVPILAPVLEALKQLGRYTDAEITAAVISAMFTVFIKSATVQNGKPIGEMLPPDVLIDAQDQSSIELGAGAVVALNPGEDVEFADPKHPNSGYDTFFNAMVVEIAAGLEIPPEVVLKQFTKNFSSARGSLNEFWRTCGMMRDWFADDFCQPIYEAFFAEAVARERIKAPGFFADPAIRKAYTDCKWNGPSRTALNPSQEVEAAIKRVDAGFSTAEEETAQLTGGDYNRNIRKRVIEAQRKREVDEAAAPPAQQQTDPEQPPDSGGNEQREGGQNNA
ncbi:phage portal protein [uncultured Dysosmobacter sp.]|uniref:phage portal protein n=1 Tax=uncultured Dysosmobacter sp. TaxID=2591384 RepID=UPI002611EFC4|nr:phage portal protein [uncultured Dysosmobacter sp.]